MSEEVSSESTGGDLETPEWFSSTATKIVKSIAAGLWNPPHDAVLISHGNGLIEPLHVVLADGNPLLDYLISQAYLVFVTTDLMSALSSGVMSNEALVIAVALSAHERLARHVSLCINDPKIRVIPLEKFVNSITFHSPIYEFEDFIRRRSIEEAKVKDLVDIHNRRAALRSTSNLK